MKALVGMEIQGLLIHLSPTTHSDERQLSQVLQAGLLKFRGALDEIDGRVVGDGSLHPARFIAATI
jgi:hypothetical protein